MHTIDYAWISINGDDLRAVHINVQIHIGHMSDIDLNIFMNCSKIVPVDANPGIINGVHIRAFDCLASGTLPLVEYRKDLDSIFKGIDVPFIKNYNDIKDLCNEFLNN